MKKKVIKNGLVGKLSGWRIGGKSYDTKGKKIKEKHEKDCFCCKKGY